MTGYYERNHLMGRNTGQIIGVVFLIFLAGSLGFSTIAPDNNVSPRDLALAVPTEPELKVAFIGDSDYGTNFRAVLNLIKAEGADMVVHLGDFDYHDDPDGFFAVVDSILGPNFPYFIIIGNHDVASWPTNCGDADGCYAQFALDRMARIGVTPDSTNLNDQMYSIAYRGLKM